VPIIALRTKFIPTAKSQKLMKRVDVCKHKNHGAEGKDPDNIDKGTYNLMGSINPDVIYWIGH
jgi:hypothetical protein